MILIDIFTYLYLALLLLSAIFYVGLVMRMFFAMGKLKQGKDITQPPPSVSVLISARNEEANLSALLESLLKQDYQGDWDIWIANDRSTDNTQNILESYAEKFPEKLHILTIFVNFF